MRQLRQELDLPPNVLLLLLGQPGRPDLLDDQVLPGLPMDGQVDAPERPLADLSSDFVAIHLVRLDWVDLE